MFKLLEKRKSINYNAIDYGLLPPIAMMTFLGFFSSNYVWFMFAAGIFVLLVSNYFQNLNNKKKDKTIEDMRETMSKINEDIKVFDETFNRRGEAIQLLVSTLTEDQVVSIKDELYNKGIVIKSGENLDPEIIYH